ncbi:MAG: TRAP transporter substrate-binding protein [Proteobacteria bacterium]|nr:TRAP transporter substrate-binding protein [Pseudomonadota bacterium]
MNPTHITLGGYQPPVSVHNQAAEVLGRELNERLHDAVSFEMDGDMVASRGIKAMDLPVMVDAGELSMCYFASSYLADKVPELGIFDLPFVVENRAKVYAALDGALGDFFKARFRKTTGMRVLGFWDNGFRHFTNRVHAIHGPDDCAGLSIRTMSSDLHQQTFRLLGFEPTFVDVADLVEAAKSGRIDAQENPLTNSYHFGTNRYHRYITLSGHFYGMALVLANNAQFESWPQAVQGAIAEAMVVATAAQRELAQAEDADILGKLDPAENEIVRLTDAERAAFKAAVGPLLAEQRKIMGDELFAHIE